MKRERVRDIIQGIFPLAVLIILLLSVNLYFGLFYLCIIVGIFAWFWKIGAFRKEKECNICNGFGRFYDGELDPPRSPVLVECKKCKGTGKVPDSDEGVED